MYGGLAELTLAPVHQLLQFSVVSILPAVTSAISMQRLGGASGTSRKCVHKLLS